MMQSLTDVIEDLLEVLCCDGLLLAALGYQPHVDACAEIDALSAGIDFLSLLE